MKFVCDRCQAKYSIADERVRGKVLKVKCKTCANVITVREARRASAAGLPTLSAGTRAGTTTKSGVHPPIDTSTETEERTQLAIYPPNPEADPFPDLDVFAPPPPVTKRPTTGPLAPVAAADDGVQWYMALDGARTGPFTRQKLVDKLMPLGKNADVHIWNERLGGWKPPTDVPEVAGEISRRRAPPPPPPLPGAPRRPTPPPIPPLGGSIPGGASHGQPARRPTGQHTPHTPHAPPSPVGHGAGGPGSKLPPPGGVHPALAARGAHETGGDPSSLLETPAPQPHMHPHPNGQKTNGVGGAGHGPPRSASSDVMQMLNLPGGTQTAPGAPPRLMSITSAMGVVAVPAPTPRSRSSIYILALLGVIGLIVVVAVISLKKPPKPVATIVKPPPVEVVAPPVVPEPPPVAPPVIEPTPPPPPTGKAGKRGGKQTRGATTKEQPAVTPPGTTVTPPPGGDAARFGDTSRPNLSVKTAVASRPAPSQNDISKVINNNRAGIKICYQRALTRDNTLTRGKLAVKLSIGISGRVKRVGLDGPAQFRLLLEPCIKDVVQRWVFPQGPDEYETEFPLVFSGNE